MKPTIEARERQIIEQARLIIDKANRLISIALWDNQNLDLVNINGLIDVNTEFDLLFREIYERYEEDANDEE